MFFFFFGFSSCRFELDFSKILKFKFLICVEFLANQLARSGDFNQN